MEMENERSVAVPAYVSVGLLVVALVLRHSWLGAILALCALAPAGYVAWLGSQSQKQNKMVIGMLLLLGGLALAILVVIGRIWHALF